MHIEYEEFNTIEDLLMYMASAAPPMKNTMPVNSYKGYVMSLIPLGATTASDSYLMLYASGSLEQGIYEFDISAASLNKVKAIERADKVYFISIAPKRNTIADFAIEKL